MRINSSWFQATMARDLLMRLPPLSLAPTPMLMPMPGMATTVMDTEVTTVATTDLMLMVSYWILFHNVLLTLQ